MDFLITKEKELKIKLIYLETFEKERLECITAIEKLDLEAMNDLTNEQKEKKIRLQKALDEYDQHIEKLRSLI